MTCVANKVEKNWYFVFEFNIEHGAFFFSRRPIIMLYSKKTNMRASRYTNTVELTRCEAAERAGARDFQLGFRIELCISSCHRLVITRAAGFLYTELAERMGEKDCIDRKQKGKVYTLFDCLNK